ncbi:MAG: adenylosuccinate lyase family protein [Erysipelotrichaceae bacterium]|nr:adenylosuccinate lyase family protein [Erysipelotrichaceae bacterium]
MRALYDSKSTSIDDRGIKNLLSEENKIKTWLKVEATLALSQAEEGFIPMEAAQEIAEKAKIENIDMEQMKKIKAKIGHGFVPFLKVFLLSCSEESGKYLHYGVTTQNIQQTSQLYILKQIQEVLYDFIADILDNFAKLAIAHKDTVIPGRTHGKHAIPVTYGYKVSVWTSELMHAVDRMKESEKRVFQVMMGGAVGGFNSVGAVGRRVQDRVAEKINMYSMEVPSRSTCVYKEEYMMNLALLCNTLHKFAEEVYYTGLEEFQEVCEAFQEGTVGSSTMPQKINPKLAKGIIANSEKLYSILPAGLYGGSRMFEGDSSSYMLMEGLLEEAVELCTEVVMRAEELTRTLHVNKESMLRNAWINKGLDNSEHVMMCVAEKLGKDKAHSLCYEKAMQVELDGKDYLQVLLEDEMISSMFTKEELEEMIDPAGYTGECSALAVEVAERAQKMAQSLRGA